MSPIFTGHIKGIPPRYCPSIEDKISRFSLKNSHNVFVEPENETAQEYYPNGLSTSLPFDIQKKFIRSIKGFEDAILTRPGYAIEYDAIYSQDLKHTLESKIIDNLFFAGQINGTTGYEEAAGQGLIAGINAHLKAYNKPPFILSRTESYIGIMIDDLVSLGVDEPYRMFTSRAERRLLLRQDNTFDRLSDKAYNLGIIDSDRYESVLKEREAVNKTILKIKSLQSFSLLKKAFTDGDINESYKIIKNELSYNVSDRVVSMIYSNLLYDPYIKREENEVLKTKYFQSLEIPKDLDFNDIPGLSIELRQKILKYRPSNIAQASIIQGMTPAAISLLIFKVRQYLKYKNNILD
jgi:tRNA uridine 5-carboxymethylaminomethyl modification enzyme